MKGSAQGLIGFGKKMLARDGKDSGDGAADELAGAFCDAVDEVGARGCFLDDPAVLLDQLRRWENIIESCADPFLWVGIANKDVVGSVDLGPSGIARDLAGELGSKTAIPGPIKGGEDHALYLA